MTQPLQSKSFSSKYLREEILGMNGVIHAAKVKSRVIGKYGLCLSEEEDASLGHIIGNVLKAMYESGDLGMYRDGLPMQDITLL